MGLGKRIWAAGYDRVNAASERGWAGELRRRLLAHARGDVLEIGGGTGANLRHYHSVDHVTITEPDAEMRARLEHRLDHRLDHRSVKADVLDASAEDLPFPDHSFDTVVSTLVLCTVRDPDRAAKEIRRVLRPGGEFLFLEHGGAAGKLGRWQHRLDPVWTKVGAGCHLTRNVEHLLTDHGFALHDVERHEPRGTAFLKPFTMGVATP